MVFHNLKKIRYMQYAATINAALTMASCGMYISWSSPTIPLLTSEDSPIGTTLTSSEAAWVASSFVLGYLPGALISGWAVSKMGPKYVLLISAVPLCLPWFAIVFARTNITLCVARFIAGLGCCLASTAIVLYNAEVSDSDIRGKLMMTNTLMYQFGSLYALCVGPFAPYKIFAATCSILPLLFIGTFWCMPDSPYHLLKTNQKNVACHNLARLMAPNSEEKLLQVRLEEINRSIEKEAKNKSTPWELLTNNEHRHPLVIMLGIVIMQKFCGASAIDVYMQTIINSSKISISPEYCSIAMGVIQIPSALLATVLVDKAGRKSLLVVSSLGCAVASFAEAMFFNFCSDSQHCADTLSWVPTAGLIVYSVHYQIGLGAIPYVLMGEIFPTNVKGHAVSMYVFLNGFLSFTVISFFERISANLGAHVAFFVFSSFCVLGIIFVVIVIPETKGKTFTEIQRILYKSKIIE